MLHDVLPPPSALGLPAHFVDWRPGQEHALNLILDAPTRFVAINAPTGTGKTLIYMGAGFLGAGRAVVLTANKQLQDQLYGEYHGLDLADVRGRGSYPCRALAPGGEWHHLAHQKSGATCNEGPCHSGMSCSLREIGCEAYDRIRLAKQAGLVSTNYALWLSLYRYSQGLGHADLLILDEAHLAPDELAGALQIRLSKWLCHALDLLPLQEGAPLRHWKAWAAHHEKAIQEALDDQVSEDEVSGSWVQTRRQLKQAAETLWAMKQMDETNWIEDSGPDAFVFEIINPAKYARSFLFQGAEKVVLLSATLTPKTLLLLGINPEEVTWWEAPSPFPIAHRRVVYVPTVKVDHRMKPPHEKILASRFDQYVSQRPGRKGICHTVSYARAKRLYDLSTEKNRLRLHHGNAAEAVAAFKQQGADAVLLSPAIDMGVDFPDETCRFQIILKLPFPSTQSKAVKARASADPDYVPYLMCQRLVQSAGRGVRHQGDWCETVIVDDNWKWARHKYSHLLPAWFKSALTWSPTLPSPYQP